MVYEPAFEDLLNHWGHSEVAVLVSRHIANGVAADRFEPNRPITRAEFIKLLIETARRGGIVEALEASNVDTNAGSAKNTPFTDVPANRFYLLDGMGTACPLLFSLMVNRVSKLKYLSRLK
ncbi:S-layer homology domain-containing protein [Paenibacillus sp. LHD-117]|uniref:S-layer homology domain-containing protein n=1 Tax=Paenibacillus sp. LHD-117 TaxID=3071412 RepID=UPI0035A8BFB4